LLRHGVLGLIPGHWDLRYVPTVQRKVLFLSMILSKIRIALLLSHHRMQTSARLILNPPWWCGLSQMLLPPYHLSDEQRSNNASDWDDSVSQLRLRNRQPFWKFYFDSELSRLVQQSFPQIYGAFPSPPFPCRNARIPPCLASCLAYDQCAIEIHQHPNQAAMTYHAIGKMSIHVTMYRYWLPPQRRELFSLRYLLRSTVNSCPIVLLYISSGPSLGFWVKHNIFHLEWYFNQSVLTLPRVTFPCWCQESKQLWSPQECVSFSSIPKSISDRIDKNYEFLMTGSQTGYHFHWSSA